MRGASRRVAVRHDSAVGNKSPFDKNSTHEAGRGTPRGPRIHRCGGVLSGGPSNALVRYTRIAVPRRPGPARGGFESPRYRERSFTYSRQSICNTGVDSWLCDVALSRSLANSSLVPLPIAPRSAPLDQMLLMNLAHQRSPSIR